METGLDWDRLVPSWNVSPSTGLQVDVRAWGRGWTSGWYQIGSWSLSTNLFPRTSPRDVSDAWGRVDTDTLLLRQPGLGAQLRCTLVPLSPPADTPIRDTPALPSLLAFSVSPMPTVPTPAPAADPNDRPDVSASPACAPHPAWGRELALPRFSQADFPEGIHAWCSPTSLAMVLTGWGERMDIPQWQVDVEHAARNVHDPAWPGTGNWSFNTAFAGAMAGMNACVAFLSGIEALEDWIASGHPVITSVSYAILKGADKPRKGDGHLIVVAGFTPTGDVIVHDPGVRRDRVRREFPRDAFVRAWTHSRNTAYLIWPSGDVP